MATIFSILIFLAIWPIITLFGYYIHHKYKQNPTLIIRNPCQETEEIDLDEINQRKSRRFAFLLFLIPCLGSTIKSIEKDGFRSIGTCFWIAATIIGLVGLIYYIIMCRKDEQKFKDFAGG